MGKKLIPDEIREDVSVIVEKFNQQELKTIDVHYIARFQVRFLYLDRIAYGEKEPVIRMEYFKKINEEEYFFHGNELVDGTIEGAVRAGMKAYPV